MLSKTTLLVVICSILCIKSYGQDLHFSQFFNSPLNVSPALTGIFNGDQRYQLNYRRQWQSVPVDYISTDLAADLKFRNEKNSNFIGVGALINYDRAGDLNLQLTEFNLHVSYSFVLNEKNIVTPGISAGYLQRSYNSDGARTGSQWDGRAYNPSFPPEFIGEESLSYLDFAAGLNYRWQNSYRSHIDVGAAVQHITSPADKFNSEGNYDSARPLLLTVYAMAQQEIAKELDLIVNGLYARQDVYNEIVGNAQLKINMSKVQDKALYFGIGYRHQDAWYPMIGMDFGQFYGAFSYDLNISDFDVATDGKGGPEISLRYIFAKIPDGPFKLCPIY